MQTVDQTDKSIVFLSSWFVTWCVSYITYQEPFYQQRLVDAASGEKNGLVIIAMKKQWVVITRPCSKFNGC